MLAKGSVASETRKTTVGPASHEDTVLRHSPSLPLVKGTPSSPRSCSAVSTLVQAVELLTDGTPNTIGANKNVTVGNASILQDDLDAPTLPKLLVTLDATLDSDGVLRYAVVQQDLLDDWAVDDDCGGEACLEGRLESVEADEPVALQGAKRRAKRC